MPAHDRSSTVRCSTPRVHRALWHDESNAWSNEPAPVDLICGISATLLWHSQRPYCSPCRIRRAVQEAVGFLDTFEVSRSGRGGARGRRTNTRVVDLGGLIPAQLGCEYAVDVQADHQRLVATRIRAAVGDGRMAKLQDHAAMRLWPRGTCLFFCSTDADQNVSHHGMPAWWVQYTRGCEEGRRTEWRVYHGTHTLSTELLRRRQSA